MRYSFSPFLIDPNKQYFIGADVATGRGSDYSSFTCMDKLGEEQVVYNQTVYESIGGIFSAVKAKEIEMEGRDLMSIQVKEE